MSRKGNNLYITYPIICHTGEYGEEIIIPSVDLIIPRLSENNHKWMCLVRIAVQLQCRINVYEGKDIPLPRPITTTDFITYNIDLQSAELDYIRCEIR